MRGESSGSVTEYRLLRTNGAPAKPFGGYRVKRSTSGAVPRHHCGGVRPPGDGPRRRYRGKGPSIFHRSPHIRPATEKGEFCA